MERIASGVQAHQCWAKKMMSYAMERDLVEADRPLVDTPRRNERGIRGFPQAGHGGLGEERLFPRARRRCSVIRSSRSTRHVVNRRAFLYGAGGIAIGLPYLEGMPERSAWRAQTNTPVFSLFICGACGVEPKRFWPSATGALSTVLASGDKAVNELKEHAANLLIVKNISFPNQGPQGCGHAEGLVQALTGTKPKSTGSKATAAGPSADVVISKAVNPSGTDPLTLYAGNIKNGYIAERVVLRPERQRARRRRYTVQALSDADGRRADWDRGPGHWRRHHAAAQAVDHGRAPGPKEERRRSMSTPSSSP